MLELTLSTNFAPGTNQKGQVAGANWRFILPSLELDRVLCVGRMASSTLSALAEIANQVVVLCPNQRTLRRVRAEIPDVNGVSFQVHDANNPFDASQFDLLYVGSRRSQRWLARDMAVRDSVVQSMKPCGMTYYETHAIRLPLDFQRQRKGPEQRFWLTPLLGETHTSVPSHDQSTKKFFFKHSLHSSVVGLKSLRRIERYVRPTSEAPLCDRLERGISKWLLTSPMTRRYGILSGASIDAAGPPEYLRTIARDSGIDLQNHRWGLHAAGTYRSRKLLFFLFPRGQHRPQYVVKMVRDAALNARLDNECDALRRLQKKGLFDSDSLPTVEFAGHHGGLAIVGESAIDGVPLRTKTDATHDCRFANRAIHLLIELGAKTSGQRVSSDRAANALQTLYETFALRYNLSPEHDHFLRQQISLVGSHDEDFPLVFQHGDPGIWNVLATPNGNAAFLDWEAAESNGVPLWDLFYFLRSFGVSVGRRAGAKSSLAAFRNQFMSESPFAAKATHFVHRCCEECSIPFEFVEPLFFTCWMHRAVKESTRLSRERMESGHYVNLLRLCIDRRNDLRFYRTPNRSMYLNGYKSIHDDGHEIEPSRMVEPANQSADAQNQTLFQDTN